MKSRSLLPLVILSLISFVSFADNSMPCGPPGAYVTVGETVGQLVADCGEPTSTQQFDQAVPNKGEKVNWYYAANALEDTNQAPMAGLTQETRYTVEFVDGKVNLIYSNYSQSGPYESYSFCGSVSPNARQEVKRGDTMDVVRNHCGDPTFTSVEDAGTPQPPVRVIQYTYTFDPSVPSIIVTTSGGVVTDVQSE